MNRLIALIAATLLLTFAACGSTKPPTHAGLLGNKVIATLQDLSTRYDRKELAGFMDLFAPEYPERKEFSSAVESVFAKYDIVQFTVQFKRMFIFIDNKGATKAAFNWDSDWETKGGSILKNSGRATFMFDPKEGKVLSIDGKNPFIPQTLESQGKPQ